ncbi:MAG: hydroxyacid dehydrogenase [Bacilli bacterium]
MPLAVVTELMDEEGLSLLRERMQVEYDPSLAGSARLNEAVARAEALIVRNQTRITRELLDRTPQLKVIGRLGVGLDNIDIAAAKERQVPVITAKNANAVAVAEYVFAAMLMTSRPIAEATAHVLAGGWDRTVFGGSELSHKTLGLVGVGEIGVRIALRARAFGMHVIAYDPFVMPYDLAAVDAGVTLTSLDDVCARAHFISLHVPLTADTRHMLGAGQLNVMRPDAVVINTSRGGVIEETALFGALSRHAIRAAVLDVLEQEPPSPIAHVRGLYLSPHVAGLTREAQGRTSELVAREVLRTLDGQASPCAVR